jgi:hypothetical protein
MTGYRSRWRRLLIAGALCLSLAPMARSQPPAGGSQISVTIGDEVRDAGGLPVSEASVTVRNTLTGVSQHQATDQRGRYSFAGLRAARYWVAASHAGLATLGRYVDVPEAAAAAGAINFRLPVAGLNQQLTRAFPDRIWDLYGSKRSASGPPYLGPSTISPTAQTRKVRQPAPAFDRPDYGRTFRVGLQYSFDREKTRSEQ